MLNVLHVIHRYPPALGGSELYAARLGNYLAKAGDRVTVYTSTADDLAAMWHHGYREFPRGCTPGNPEVARFKPLRFPGRRYIAKALSLIGSHEHRGRWMPCNPILQELWHADGPERLDAVHGFAFPYANPLYAGLRIARRRGVPFYLTPFLHWASASDPRDPVRLQYTQPTLRELLLQADAVFVQTYHEQFLATQLGVQPERIVKQGLGVDAKEVIGGRRHVLRERFGLDDRAVVVGHLANLSREKGTIDLLEASRKLPEFVHLFLAGKRMPKFSIPSTQPRIHYLGVLSEAEKRDFYAAIDLFCLPSRSDSFGLVLLEAWANGVPNIVYRAGGPGELVRHGIDGLSVPCGHIASLHEALHECATDEAFRKGLGAAGAQRIPQEFRWEDKLALVRNRLLRDRDGR